MANAGCINAYDCNGCLIQTLQNLDSACIGVGVQYTAPNPLDDKRLDYIKYTDKCGCVQCLSAENEILIYATNGVIKNLTLTNDDVNEAIKIKWNDIFGSNRAKTIVRYKTGSAPVSITDGTLAVEETTKNQYSSTPFSLTGVLDETTYYITAFAVDSNNVVIGTQQTTITTSFGWHPSANTLLYFPFLNDTSDHSGHGITLTNSGTKGNTGYVFTSTSKLSTTDYDTQIKYLGIWYKLNSVSETTNNGILEFPYMGFTSYNAGQVSTNYRGKIAVNGANWTILGTTPGMSKGEWHHLAYIYDGTKVNISKDGIITTIYNGSSVNHRLNNPITLAEVNGSMNVEIGDVIGEKIVWSEEDIQKYINRTKSRYGL